MNSIPAILPVKLGSIPIRTLFSVHFLFSSSVQNAVDVYLLYSEDTLKIIWEKQKGSKRNMWFNQTLLSLFKFISTKFIIQWHEIILKI